MSDVDERRAEADPVEDMLDLARYMAHRLAGMQPQIQGKDGFYMARELMLDVVDMLEAPKSG